MLAIDLTREARVGNALADVAADRAVGSERAVELGRWHIPPALLGAPMRPAAEPCREQESERRADQKAGGAVDHPDHSRTPRCHQEGASIQRATKRASHLMHAS